MQKRRLGNTDIEVSVLGLGTVKFGRNQGVKYPQAFSLPSDKEVKNILSKTRELEINLLDTAPAYGSSEERIGKILHSTRHEWVIMSKVGEEFVNNSSSFDFSSEGMRKSIERSLQRLKTDYLDIVLVHSNGDDEFLIKEEKVFSTLEKFKQDGKIRAYGFSSKTVVGGMLTLERADCAMVTLNPEYTDEAEVVRYAAKHQKGIFIKKAFASGHLNWQSDVSPIEASFRCIFKEPGVTSVIVGTINPAHLEENALTVERVLALLNVT